MKVTSNTLARRAMTLELPSPEATVIDRIRYLIKFMRKTQAQFGELIAIDPSNMSKMLSGRVPISDRTINRIVVNLGVSKSWLVSGDDVPFPREAAEEIPTYSDVRGLNAITDGHKYMIGAPVYDIDVTAGHTELSTMFTDDRIVGRLNLPTVNPEYPIVRVSGDSMSPRIPHGSFIAIRQMAYDVPIFWGHTYVVVTDDYRMVKVVRRHHDDDKVILHSFNSDYDDMEMPRDKIRALYLVEAILHYEVLG